MDEHTIIGQGRCHHGNDQFNCPECKENYLRGANTLFAKAKKKSSPPAAPGEKACEHCGTALRPDGTGYHHSASCPIQLQTEQEMHSAWRKRAEQAESELAQLKKKSVQVIKDLEIALSTSEKEAAELREERDHFKRKYEIACQGYDAAKKTMRQRFRK